MSLRTRFRENQIAVKLTIWYASFFLFISVVMMSLIYFQINNYVFNRIDDFFLSEAGEFERILERAGSHSVIEVIKGEETAIGDDEVFFRLLDTNGTVLASSAWVNWPLLMLLKPSSTPLTRPEFHWVTLTGYRDKTRIMFFPLSSEYIFQVGQTVTAEGRLLKTYKNVSIRLVIASLFLSIAIGLFMARRALSGVGRIAKTAASISESSLNERVPEMGNGDEIDRLAGTFNAMLDRVRNLVRGMNEINDNIAHDLRSPLTRIRGQAETTLLGEASLTACQSALATVIEESDRLLEIINTMLTISEMEAGAAIQDLQTCNLAKIVHDAYELFSPVACDKYIQLTVDAPSLCLVKGDMKKLQRAIANILDNAVKYTPKHGSVHIGVASDREQVQVVISDSGNGIADHEMPRIFERFYRSQTITKDMGSGLGLSLARSIVRAYGGDIDVNSNPGKGSTFVIRLPAVV